MEKLSFKKRMIIQTILLVIVIISVVLIIRDYNTKQYFKNFDIVKDKKTITDSSGNAVEKIENFCIEYIELKGEKNAYKIPYGNCSFEIPYYCDNGKIVSNCKKCGCENGDVCQDTLECKKLSTNNLGGGAGGEGGASGSEDGGAGGEGGGGAGGAKTLEKSSDNDCYDSDESNTPNPIFSSGSCKDSSSTYQDKCEDPVSSVDSTIWIKEYKCQKISNVSVCIANYKSCPSSAMTYFGVSDSTCQSNKCSTPIIAPIVPIINENVNASCTDSIKNQDETNTDCGGVCGGYYYNNLCNINPQATCSDSIKNQDETNIDCGGVCGGYWYLSACHQTPQASCSDGIKNQNEEGIDCGGVCTACIIQNITSGNSGGGSSGNCYIENSDSKGLTIFSNSVCHDLSGSYSNSCSNPNDLVNSNLFIKSYVCSNDVCTGKFYSCKVMGNTYFQDDYYVCKNNVCQN